MRRLAKRFGEICTLAEKFNAEKRQNRFQKMYNQDKRFVSFGIYDTVTKQYVLFDTVNLTGNFRYSNNTAPPELDEMENLIRKAR